MFSCAFPFPFARLFGLSGYYHLSSAPQRNLVTSGTKAKLQLLHISSCLLPASTEAFLIDRLPTRLLFKQFLPFARLSAYTLVHLYVQCLSVAFILTLDCNESASTTFFHSNNDPDSHLLCFFIWYQINSRRMPDDVNFWRQNEVSLDRQGSLKTLKWLILNYTSMNLMRCILITLDYLHSTFTFQQKSSELPETEKKQVKNNEH